MGALLPLLVPFVNKLLGMIPDPSARAAAEAEWAATTLQLLTQSDDRQSRVNEVEAQSESLFKSGWRPATGWLCVFGLFLHTVGYPLLGWALTVWAPGTPIPIIDTDSLISILVGLLGLGGYRTIERLKRRA